jgi:phosphoglycolate phosphatase
MKIRNNLWNRQKSQAIKAVVFDMDGTLYSSESILHQAYVAAVRDFNRERKLHVPTPSLQEILHQIGQPASAIFKNLFPDLSSEEQKVLNSFSLKNLCQSISQGGGELYPGIIESLSFLQSIDKKLFIASNGRTAYLSSILQGFSLTHFFENFVTLEMNGIDTKAGIILYYMKESAFKAEEVLMVGDRTSDIDAARIAGTWFAGVLWGHDPGQEVADADIILEDTLELRTLFKN